MQMIFTDRNSGHSWYWLFDTERVQPTSHWPWYKPQAMLLTAEARVNTHAVRV